MKDHDLSSVLSIGSPSGSRRTWRCPDEARITAFVRGELPAERRQALHGHLADCAFCRGQVGFLVRAERIDPSPVSVPGHLLARARGERSHGCAALRPATVLVAGCTLVLALLQVAPLGRPHLSPRHSGSSGMSSESAWAGAIPRASAASTAARSMKRRIRRR